MTSSSSNTLPHLFFGEDQIGSNGSSFNPKVISFIRDEWIHEAVAAREAEFTEYRPLRLFVGTYNVNGKVPKEDLGPWLCESGLDEASIPDVYVCGLQEMVDLTATNVALQTQCGKRAKDWSSLLETTLNSVNPKEAVFELVSSKYLVGVFMKSLIDLSKTRNVTVQLKIAAALEALATDNLVTQTAIMEYGAVDHMINLLKVFFHL
jgi:hypothetical protein